MNIILNDADLIFEDDDILGLQVSITRRPRTFFPRINFNMEDPYFVEKFRMPSACVQFLLERLGPHIAHPTICSGALSPLQQILVTLHWLGNGSQYHGIGNIHGISKASVCRCVNKVCSSISQQLLNGEVAWPEDRNGVSADFYRIAGMPRIAGAVDGTLIPIDAPANNEQSFVDRKGIHSINVMLVAGADYRFYAINSNYPGSVHDSRVLQCSSFYRKWNNEGWRPFPGAIILGDSAYPLRKWLYSPNVPVAIEESTAKNRFVAKHKKTRQVVECSLGQLKEIFPCLNKLRLKSALSCANVVNACVALFNIRKRMTHNNDIVLVDSDNDAENEDDYQDTNEDNSDAIAELANYINFFNN